ncbi:hypothetical protein AB0I77_42725 [Streptomyces sp. NPDC050619]|uniref:hypothetical protein n=1 Tax=Streptomyces sp. NPDC050619 TaxID=3157214 RepID=UPI003434D076
MTLDQLPGRVREFANYLDGLLARLDQGGGWCGVFWQRDPDGMQACLDGREMPPWDVVEALLQDLAAGYGPDAARAEAERARALHAAALVAYDARPGGRDALGDRFDVMLREQRYAAERQAELGRLLATATTQQEADALRLDLAWARDDHERATRRCAELRARMAEMDHRTVDGQVQPIRRGQSEAGAVFRMRDGVGDSRGARSDGRDGYGSRSDGRDGYGSRSGGGEVYGGAHSGAGGTRGARSDGRDGYGARSDGGADSGAGDTRGARSDGRDAYGSGSDGGGVYAGADSGAGDTRGARSDGREGYGSRSDGRDAYGSGSDGGEVYGGARSGARDTHGSRSDGRDAYGSRSDGSETYGGPHSGAGDTRGTRADGREAYGARPDGRDASYRTRADGRDASYGTRAGSQDAYGARSDAHDTHDTHDPYDTYDTYDTAFPDLPQQRDARTANAAAEAGHPEYDDPAPTAPQQPAPAQQEPTPIPKQRKRRRGSARFAGIAAEDAVAPVAVPPAVVPDLPAAPVATGRTPRGARFAGVAKAGAKAEPRREALDEAARRETVETVERLVRLRGEGRSGEAHALLAEIAYWPAARYPLLAAELQRGGLGADWATLLWEAASLPADRLVAAADALVAAGRGTDAEQVLRQGVARPAAEIGEAVLGLAAEGRRREVRALLDAYVSVRTPEEAARSAEPDPQTLVPLLLEAAQSVSDERHWDLVHALRVAGFSA